MAGLIQPVVVKGDIPRNTPFDNIIDSGIYAQDGDSNINHGLPEGYKHGTLIVFNCGKGTAGGGSPVVQLFFDSNPMNPVLLRTHWVSIWSNWSQL